MDNKDLIKRLKNIDENNSQLFKITINQIENKEDVEITVQGNQEYDSLLLSLKDLIESYSKETIQCFDIENLLKEEDGKYIDLCVVCIEKTENLKAKLKMYLNINYEEYFLIDLTLYKKIETLLEKMSERISFLLKLKNSNDLIIDSEFKCELIYKNIEGNWLYQTFVKQIDRPISQQKEDINKFLLSPAYEKINEIVRKIGADNQSLRNIFIKFNYDGNEISEISYACD